MFLQLIGGIGRYHIAIEVRDLHEDEIIAQQDGEIEFSDRLNRLSLEINVPPLPLDHPGAYDVVVLADGQEIDRQQFEAVLVREPNGEQEQENAD